MTDAAEVNGEVGGLDCEQCSPWVTLPHWAVQSQLPVLLEQLGVQPPLPRSVTPPAMGAAGR